MATKITPKRRKELAVVLGLSEQYLYQCLTGRREMDAAEARRVEVATKGELSRRMLCQKSHQAIWPDLAAAITSTRKRTTQAA